MGSPNPQDQFTLVEHLSELRTRIVYSLYAIAAFTVLTWNFKEEIFAFVRRPIQPYLPEGGLIFTAPADNFMAHFKVAIFSAVILACPVWVYQLWMFVAPGLYKKEKKYGLYFIFFGTFLFLLGVSFVYFFVYPVAFEFLLTFGGGTERPMISVNDYLSFFMMTTLVFGAAFELPLVITLLGIAGVVNKKLLKATRRYAIVLICVVSAVVTPPDLMSMVLLALPLMALYELSIILVGWLGPKIEEV